MRLGELVGDVRDGVRMNARGDEAQRRRDEEAASMCLPCEAIGIGRAAGAAVGDECE